MLPLIIYLPEIWDQANDPGRGAITVESREALGLGILHVVKRLPEGQRFPAFNLLVTNVMRSLEEFIRSGRGAHGIGSAARSASEDIRLISRLSRGVADIGVSGTSDEMDMGCSRTTLPEPAIAILLGTWSMIASAVERWPTDEVGAMITTSDRVSLSR